MGKSVVLDVSGSTITVGANTNFAASASDDICVAVLSSSKAIIGYGVSDVAYAVVVDIGLVCSQRLVREDFVIRSPAPGLDI